MLFLYERHLKQNISFGITVPPLYRYYVATAQ